MLFNLLRCYTKKLIPKFKKFFKIYFKKDFCNKISIKLYSKNEKTGNNLLVVKIIISSYAFMLFHHRYH